MKLFNSKNFHKKGFTAVELMVTVCIFAILAAIATPQLGDWMNSITAQSKANSIMAAINKARSEALVRNQAIVFKMNSTGYWEFGCVRVNTTTSSSGYCPGAILQKNTEPSSTKGIITVTPSDSTYIVFNNMGVAVDNSTYGSSKISSINVSSNSSTSAKVYNIVIRSGGSAKMCLGSC